VTDADSAPLGRASGSATPFTGDAALGSQPLQVHFLFSFLNIASTLGGLALAAYCHSRSATIAFVVTYTICGLGLTMGYHRLFAHRSYSVPLWLEHAIAVCGYAAIQRGPIFWVAMHRLHHKYTDVIGRDPHTPLEGIFHVHFGWIQSRRRDVWDPTIYRSMASELVNDPLYLWMDSEVHDHAVNVALILASFLLGGMIGGGGRRFDVHNGICFLAWVGLLNRVALLHAFGFINSVCHLVGTRPFRCKEGDRSTNNFIVSLLIFGDGWHNNHHAFPQSAKQGLRWYQLDVAWYAIWLLQQVGLATHVKVPSPASLAVKTRRPARIDGPG